MAPTLTITILADAARAKKALAETGTDVENLGDKSAGMGKAIAAGAAVGVAGLVALGVGAFEAASESARIGRETERVIRTTGAAAWTSADQVADLAGAISDKTGADDEAIQSGANLLLTFTNIRNEVGEGNDVFDEATGLALDMSTALGTDMSAASIQLGKALNDPVKGIAALSKAGVSFTQEQKDQIKILQQSGDVLGAQKIVLAELSKEFGGAAEAAGTPFDKLMVKIGNLQEDIGAKLIPAVQSVATFIGDNMGPAITKVTGFLSEHGEAVKFLATVGLTGLAAAYTPVIVAQAELAAAGLIGWVTQASGYLSTLSALFLETAAAEGVLTAATTTLSITALPATVAVVALAAAVYGFANAGQEGERAAERFITGLDVQTHSLTSLREGIAATGTKVTELGTRGGSAMDRLGGIADVLIPWHDVTNSVEDARGEYDKFKATNADWQEQLNASNATIDKTIEKLNAQAAATGQTTLTGEALRAKLEEIAAAKQIDLTQPGAAQNLMAVYTATTHVTTSTLNMSEAQVKYNDATSTAKDKTDAYKTSLDALIGIHVSAAEAETRFSQNSMSLLKTLVTNREAAAGATKAGTDASLAQIAAIDANNSAIQGNVKSAIDLANAMFQETGDLDGATSSLATHRQSLIDTMVQTGYTREEAEAYITRLGLTPEAINTQVNLDNQDATGKLTGTQGQLNTVAQGANAVVTADTGPAERSLTEFEKVVRAFYNRLLQDFKNRGGIVSVLGGSIANIEGRASGGPVLRGRPYVVGEHGPELFIAPGSGTIVPASSGTARAGGSVVNNFTVNVSHTGLGVDSPRLQRDVVETLNRWVKRNGRPAALVGT